MHRSSKPAAPRVGSHCAPGSIRSITLPYPTYSSPPPKKGVLLTNPFLPLSKVQLQAVRICQGHRAGRWSPVCVLQSTDAFLPSSLCSHALSSGCGGSQERAEVEGVSGQQTLWTETTRRWASPRRMSLFSSHPELTPGQSPEESHSLFPSHPKPGAPWGWGVPPLFTTVGGSTWQAGNHSTPPCAQPGTWLPGPDYLGMLE